MRGGPQHGTARGPAVTATDTVLVVDDTPSKRYLLANWLRRGGFTVVEAATGTDALRMVRDGGIDLVVLDVRLPDMTGFEVCEKIKADPLRDPIPVVHVSAAAVHAVDRTQGLQRGADAYLVEPIDPDELLATTTSILRYYKARSQAEMLAGRLTGLTQLSLAMTAATTPRAVLGQAASGSATRCPPSGRGAAGRTARRCGYSWCVPGSTGRRSTSPCRPPRRCRATPCSRCSGSSSPPRWTTPAATRRSTTSR